VSIVVILNIAFIIIIVFIAVIGSIVKHIVYYCVIVCIALIVCIDSNIVITYTKVKNIAHTFRSA
jgi:hypothetical protein